MGSAIGLHFLPFTFLRASKPETPPLLVLWSGAAEKQCVHAIFLVPLCNNCGRGRKRGADFGSAYV